MASSNTYSAPTLTPQQKQAANLSFMYAANNNLAAVKQGLIASGVDPVIVSKMSESDVVTYLNNGFAQYGKSWAANILQNFQHNPNSGGFSNDPAFLSYLATSSALLKQSLSNS